MSRSVRLGAILWILTVEFFLAQFVAEAAWPQYSMIGNDISVLGAARCGVPAMPVPGGVAVVCSPLNWVFDVGVALNGLLIIAGVWLTRRVWTGGWVTRAGLALVAAGGVGSFLVGVAPFDTRPIVHGIGAFLALFVGAAGIFLLGMGMLRTRPGWAIYALATGALCMAAFVLFVRGDYLGLGRGVMERVAAFPHTFWYMAMGTVLALGPAGTSKGPLPRSQK